MKFYITILILIFAVVVGGFSAICYLNYGWGGLVGYLVFAAMCTTPSVISWYRWYKEKGGSR